MKNVAAAVAVCLCSGFAFAQVTSFGPTPYLSCADSPFAGGMYQWFTLLNAEPGSASAPGISILNTSGGSISPYGPSGICDSVDADDGVIDGSGAGGHSYFTCPSSVEIRFVAAVLGSLPTHAGVVWTDGAGIVTVSAYDAANTLVGTVTGSTNDGNYEGGTAEDRFYGFTFPGGISRLTIADQNNCIEFDHVQAGRISDGGPGCGCGPCGTACDAIDFNHDGVFPSTDDLADFLSVFGGGPCSTGTCGDIDFNNDGVFPSSDDIDALFRVFAGGTC